MGEKEKLICEVKSILENSSFATIILIYGISLGMNLESNKCNRELADSDSCKDVGEGVNQIVHSLINRSNVI